MSRSLLSLAAGVLALSLTSTANAGGPSHGGSMSHYSMSRSYSPSYSSFKGFSNSSYMTNYGTKFSGGYSFTKSNFRYSSYCYSSRYGCYCYWSPYASCYYYWCAPQSCYYPLSYISYAPPTVTVNVTPGGPVGTPGPVGTMPPAGPPVP
jgi:hypothetical protein